MVYRSANEYEIKCKIQSVAEKIRAFCSQILQQIDKDLVHCQVLFLAPTIDRARQIEQVMRSCCDHVEIKINTCVVENCIETNKSIISTGVHLIVGTPWNMLNLLSTKKQSLHLDHVRMVVLDEVDEMLSGKFDGQVIYFFIFTLHF